MGKVWKNRSYQIEFIKTGTDIEDWRLILEYLKSGKTLTPPLPLPLMGGERLRTEGITVRR